MLTLAQRPFSQRATISSTSWPVPSANVGSKTSSTFPNTLILPSRSYSQGSAVSRLARSAASPGAAAETYVAYGMTQKIFEACSKQGDYTIPQASQKGVEVPLTESGEHLGVSDSWWYKGS